MKRKSITLAVLSLALFYLLAAACLSVGAPNAALASTMGGCSDTKASSTMFPCENPSFSCRSAAADNHAIVSSIQSRDPSLTAAQTVVTMAVISPPDAVAPSLARSGHAISFGPSQKIPIHLLNSVLSI